jgi:hypothetical protein
MKLTPGDGTDVTLARGGGRGVTLVAIPHTGRSFVDGFVHAARADRATVTQAAHGASAIELPRNAARVVVGLRGCNAVVVDGRRRRGRRRRARRVSLNSPAARHNPTGHAGRGGSMSLKSFWCALAAAAALALTAAASAGASTVWLCRPGAAPDPCSHGLKTTRTSPTGAKLGTFTPSTLRGRPVDCFYVYPTVSDQQTPLANRHIDPEERSIALYQAARYSSLCRVFAPMYRQVTLSALFAGTATAAQREVGYRDVRDAWRLYLKRYNHGRGVILIGHSQGTFVLRNLVAREIDGKPAARRRLISAILLGGNVTVKPGKDAGGDFQHVRACRSASQLQCVIAFSTFNDSPPPDSLFGRAPAGLQVLCTNPAALGGGSAKIDTILPNAPFAPSTSLGMVTPSVGYPPVTTTTPWIEADGVYTAACSDEGGASVLRIGPATPDAPQLHPVPDATWGLHLADANIALGNLIRDVTRQARRYLAVRR